MTLDLVRLLGLFFTVFALVPAVAYLAELPRKIKLPAQDYLNVQQIHRGWALFGIVVLGALLSTLTLAIMVRHLPQAFALTLLTLMCILGTQVVFWTLSDDLRRRPRTPNN